VAQQFSESTGEAVAQRVAARDADKRRVERHARDQHANEAEPQANRSRSAQPGAARQHGFRKTPEKREKPQG
jgi:hypothetical protein